ncbi:MAG: SCO family protein [Pseudomonadota bacterium]
MTTDLLRKIRIAAWVLVGIVAVAAGGLLMGSLQQAVQSGRNVPAALQIGGPFELTSHRGTTFSSEQLKGKPYAMFFGFTHCPDICPSTLLEVSQKLDALGADADKLEVLFITVDPERDTVEQLATYMGSFHDRITALTGTPEQVASVTKAYRAYYKKVPSADDPTEYTMDHSATIYLIDGNGRLASTLDWKEADEVQLKKLKKLVGALS